MARRTAFARQQTEAELDPGRLFRAKPSEPLIERFRKYVAKHGTPVGFPGIAWTKPNEADIPIPLTKFAAPETLRKKVPMAPCPVCSARGPKYYEGVFCYFEGDRRIRAIGHECGKDFFEGDAYEQAIDMFDRDAKLKAALVFLRAQMPELPRRMIEARYAIFDFDLMARVRDELVATITKRATQAVLRARGPQGALFVERASGLRDHRGAGLTEKVTVTRPVAIDGLACSAKSRSQTHEARVRIGPSIVLRDHEHPLWRAPQSWQEYLTSISYEAVLALEADVRAFYKAHAALADDVAALRALLTIANLNELARWGMHRDAPTPFWIKASIEGLRAANGPHTSAPGRKIVGWPLG